MILHKDGSITLLADELDDLARAYNDLGEIIEDQPCGVSEYLTGEDYGRVRFWDAILNRRDPGEVLVDYEHAYRGVGFSSEDDGEWSQVYGYPEGTVIEEQEDAVG